MEFQDLNVDVSVDVDVECCFGGVVCFYGVGGLVCLQVVYVCVIGIGGVGLWVVEVLVCLVVGVIMLIDFDYVVEFNINCQIQVGDVILGMVKIEVMVCCISGYVFDCKFILIDDFFDEDNVGLILLVCDGIVDVIDNVCVKVVLIVYCKKNKIFLIIIGGVGGCVDLMWVQVDDLLCIIQDVLVLNVCV